jgi:hypothetical protein
MLRILDIIPDPGSEFSIPDLGSRFKKIPELSIEEFMYF